MTYTVRVLRRAEGDLSEIYDHIAEDSPRRAVEVVERVLDRIESLSELPSRGAPPRDERLKQKGYRFVIEHSYLILYKVGSSQIWVHRVVHGKRAYERIL